MVGVVGVKVRSSSVVYCTEKQAEGVDDEKGQLGREGEI